MDAAHSQSGWVVDIDGETITNLQNRKANNVNEGWEDIRDTAANILGQCPNPRSNAGRVTGLALGKIQSGKTLSYTALIALAIDNGYRITVVLAGTKNPLLKQNYSRLRNDLQETGNSGKPKILPLENPTPELNGDVIETALEIKSHVLIVALKNRKRIEDVRAILARPETNHYPTLIIDDEGDEASLNTLFRKGRRSAIYRSIVDLRDSLQIHAYVAYTATPQAPLLISGIDALAPDFGMLIQPGQGYCGGSVFFGENSDQYLRGLGPPDIATTNCEGIPSGLRRAIATFLVGGAIRRIRGDSAWHSMLIHTSPLKVEHERLLRSVRTLINSWKTRLSFANTDPALVDLMATFETAYNDLRTTIKNPPLWEIVKEQLKEETILLQLWIVNSLPIGQDPVSTPFVYKNNILIGGNMLGRGVTIPGLAVTYITRRAQKETNADTMEQRARWFGYKSSYLDVCRIFLTAQLIGDYVELLTHEDDFWASLIRNQNQGLSIRDWPRMLRLESLRPTRQNVASYRRFVGQGWDNVQRILIQDSDVASKNLEVTRSFFHRNGGYARKYGNTEYLTVESCPIESVIEDLLKKVHTSGTDWDNSYVIEYLTRLLLDERLLVIDVLFMSKNGVPGIARTRALARDSNGTPIPGKIENPFQGHTPNKSPRDPDYYQGDRNLPQGSPQLQVHWVLPENSTVETTAFALYIPEDPQFNMQYVIRDESP